MRLLKDRRKSVAIALVVAVALGILLWWGLARQAAAREATRLTANGTIDADELEIGAQRPARLVRYRVAEGQSVKAGQVIAELDVSELQAQLEAAEGAAAAAAARLKELERGGRPQARANVEGARRTLANARKGYERRTELKQALDAAEAQRDVAQEALRQAKAALAGAESGLRTAGEEHGTNVQLRQARDAARSQLNAARASHRAASAQLEQLVKGPRVEVVRAAEASARQAKAAVDVARRDLTNADSDLTRARQLHAGNALSDQQLDAAQTRADTTRARHEQAQEGQRQAEERLTELRTGSRPEEIETGRAAVQQAQAAIDGAQSALANAEEAYTRRLGARGQLEGAQTGRRVASTQVASARAALAGAELAVRNARTAYQDALREKQSFDSALQQYQAGLAQLEATEAQFEQARAQLRQARGALDLARVQKGQTVIRAPRGGVLTEHVALVGEVVNPGATVAKLVPLDEVFLTLYVPLTELGKVKIGQRVEVTADTFPGKTYPGTITLISDTPEFTPRNVQTRDERVKLVFQVKVAVENPRRELKPGMPADATVRLDESNG